MDPRATELLRTANRNLRVGISRLAESAAAASFCPDDLTNLLVDLAPMADCLLGIPRDCPLEDGLERELSEYRANLQELARLLPTVHRRLLAEKVQLEIARSHVQAASAWAQASQKTL